MKKAYFNWSGGKDSALALYRALRDGEFSVEALFSVLKCDGQKVAMHETGIGLLKSQADAIGIPLVPFYFNPDCSDETYRKAMLESMYRFRERGIATALFGDLHLDSLRKARERKCREAGMQAVFPLWGMSPENVLAEFVQSGFRAIVTCVDNSVLPEDFVGKVIDESFLSELPEGVDVCGENGEYHSFVFDGPIFRHPVGFRIKEKYSKTFSDTRTGASQRYTYLELEEKYGDNFKQQFAAHIGKRVDD